MTLTMRYQICTSFVLAGAGALVFAGPVPPAGTRATLGVLETTDVHSNVLGYDYYRLAPDPSLGLDRTATLIAQARREFANTLLLDNGDTIQGTALADYQALARPLPCNKTLAVYKALNALGVEGAGVGNHEFNYGLAYLSQVTGSQFDVAGVDAAKPRCAGPAFPQVLANIYSAKTHKPLFAPYRIIDKRISATGPDGKSVSATLRVGIIGFTPPTILSWDKRWLDGKVYTEGVVETARKYLPEMRAGGADIVLAISHGGLDDSPYRPDMENGNWHLAKVPGIDALLLGHIHQVFPNKDSAIAQFNLPGVDKAKGTVHGVPTVMANLWGKHLGVIGLQLTSDGQRWVVDTARTTVEARSTRVGEKGFVEPDAAIAALVAEEHAATIGYVKTPIGRSEQRMSTYFADVGDISAIEVVNRAQAAYVARYVQAGMPQYAGLPVLSMAAAFKGGSVDAADYTDVAPGPLALNNAADLYLYPNVLHAVKIDGATFKAWLEKSALRFRTIDPASKAAQELVDPGFPPYNFDVPTSKDVHFEIDVTKAPGGRIVGLAYKGKPVADGDQFLVATNSYRASGGGNFPGLDGSKTVIVSPDANRDVLIDFIKQAKVLTRAKDASAHSWRFAKVRTAGPVVFHSAPGKLAQAREAGLTNISQLKADDGLGRGFAVYRIDLSK
jgi:2',3'-cyclic-nucleotide 2'-phosphodiesterase/3'-nucleotidase